MSIKLSILIPTLVGRESFHNILCESLLTQIGIIQEIEIISMIDNKEITIGEKRNNLLAVAKGKYCVFIDDDDTISDNYIAHIMNAIKKRVDVVEMRGRYFQNGRYIKPFIHSLKHTTYSEDANYFYRPPNHLNPMRTEIARSVKFKTISHGEDTDWAMQISNNKLLKTESPMNQLLYNYYYISQKKY